MAERSPYLVTSNSSFQEGTVTVGCSSLEDAQNEAMDRFEREHTNIAVWKRVIDLMMKPVLEEVPHHADH